MRVDSGLQATPLFHRSRSVTGLPGTDRIASSSDKVMPENASSMISSHIIGHSRAH